MNGQPTLMLQRIVAFAALIPAFSHSQTPDAHQQIMNLVERHSAQYAQISKSIWEYAELGYREQKSSNLLQRALKDAGFQIEAGVAGEPTAFIASYGSGKPIIALLGEFDALPGLSQQAVPERSAVTKDAPGHGCGHNLLGAGAALAAVALKDYMVANHTGGTLRFYGTPAEEGGDGKVYMVRAGLFRDVSVVLHWHPGDRNVVSNGGMLAITGARFRFHGVAAHAAFAPERGRSALDAVMLMGNGIEFMREHIPSTTRIHYVISNGGGAPNIVPDTAELNVLARSPYAETLQGIWERITKISEGAAMMTETSVETIDLSGDANILPNDALAPLAQKDLQEAGGYTMNDSEKAFALALQKTLPPGSEPRLSLTAEIQPLQPFNPNAPMASTDVGDVSWHVPTIGFNTATFVPGVVPHTWQAAACAGMSIGQKGMIVAATALALTAADLFSDPALIEAAKGRLQQTADRQKILLAHSCRSNTAAELPQLSACGTSRD